MFEEVGDREYVKNRMEWGDGGGAEDPTHFVNGVVLSNLEGIHEGFLWGGPGVPEWCAVCEDGDDDGMEHLSPVSKVETSNGVP